MAGPTFTKQEFWAELVALGEERVRENLATKRYGGAGHKKALAEEWLRHQETLRQEHSNREQIAIARDAADAAWEAARAAKSAAKTARIALAIAAISIIISAISLFFPPS